MSLVTRKWDPGSRDHARESLFFRKRQRKSGVHQFGMPPMVDNPNNSPLLRHASNAFIVSKNPAKVTLPPSPARPTAAGMNFSHTASVSCRDSPAADESAHPSISQRRGEKSKVLDRLTELRA